MGTSTENLGIDELIEKTFRNKLASIDTLLAFCTEHDCSDLYIKAGTRPHINRHGRMYEVPCMPINDIAWNEFAKVAISSENNAKYVREKMLDFSYSVDVPEDSKYSGQLRVFRYRVSAGFSQRRPMATFRMINPVLPSFKRLDFPPQVERALRRSFESKTGIILLTGPTGSGKTTTLASCINDYTKEGPLENSMIITLEDPIEYVYGMSKNSRIIQKELGIDFKTFSSGVKQALREHPTHILCGEIRDREGINVCVEASRTGHKVITTFHTDDVAGTVSRMYFYLASGDNTEEAMYDLITHLDFVLCQRLVASPDGGFKLETQYMMFIDEIKKVLQKVIERGGNIPIAISNLFNNEALLKHRVVKDWS